jgi:predicted amidohydrolase YtcJ
MEYISPRMRFMMKHLFLPGTMQGHSYEGPDYRARVDEIYARTTASLRDTGARIVLGTDSLNPYLVPGFSLHEELAHLVRAGFSPYEAIEAGTRHAAEALGKGDEFGTLREGMRADLLLVRDNPLDDAANAAKREGVMLHGHWLPEARLQELLAGLSASYTPTPVDRVWPLFPILLGISMIPGAWFK